MKASNSNLRGRALAAFAPALACLFYTVDSTAQLLAPPKPPSAPALIPAKPPLVRTTFFTGGDDLRGGNDNVHLVLSLPGGTALRSDNVNDRQRWIDHSVAAVARALPDTLRADEVEGLRLETTLGRGIGGDNWHLDALTVFFRFRESFDWIEAFLRGYGAPLVRFTGDRKRAELRFHVAR